MGSNDKNQVSINVFEQIDTICAEFRKQYRAGKRPDISAFLPKVNEQAQSVLFRNLISTEIRLRRQNGDTPKSSDYLKRFPQFANIIRQEFDESTMGSMDFNVDPENGSTGTASQFVSDGTQTRTFEEPAASRLGDYELIRELGRGGFGVVYEARHIKQKNKVALKTLPTGSDGQEINADRLHKFRREFRTLSEINHPNLVGMQTLEFDGNQWFFTMDLIQGTDFLSYVRPKDWLDEKHLRSSLKQLAAGIMALHDKGIVHRDLKPSNVLVEPNGRVVILDFGLVAQLQQNTDMTATRSAMFAGTPRYAAPEQMFGERSEASDWYAMGVMLYEALTGAPPFPGRNPMEVLKQKQDEDPPSISNKEDLSSDLATLADALIKRDPKQRLTTNQIAQQLQLDLESTKQQSAGSTDDEDIDLDAIPEEEIELIGREKQLAQLESAKQQLLETRKPVVCWITGLSGEGKSALAEKFLAPIRRGTEMLVLSGRCYDRESVPFKVIDSQIDSLVRYLRSLPDEEVAMLLPPDIGMLARIFPVLNRVAAIREKSAGQVGGFDQQQIRNLAFAAFRDLLSNIGNSVPVIMFVDDLQWGDADSAEAFVNLLSPPDPPLILFVGSYRTDEMNSSTFLKSWSTLLRNKQNTIQPEVISVDRLSDAECAQFVLQKFGNQFDPEMLQKLLEGSKGNPYFLEQMLEGIDVEERTITQVALADVISKRLGRCPPDAEDLLNLIAIAGKSIALSELASVGGYRTIPSATITHMRSEKLVRLIGTPSDQLVDTYHDKIRETIYDRMDQAQRNASHLKFAKSIELQESINPDLDFEKLVALRNDRIFDLAHHYTQAKDTRAFKYQLTAGQMATDAYANENALDHLCSAEALISVDGDPSIHYHLNYLMGIALKGVSQLYRATKYFDAASKSAQTSLEKAKCFYMLGRVYWMQSNYKNAFVNLNLGFRELGEQTPKSAISKVYSGVVSIVKFHFWPSWLLNLFRQQSEEELDFLSRMYSLLTLLVIQLDVYSMFRSVGRACLIAKKSKLPAAKVLPYANYGSIIAQGGIAWLGRRMMAKAEKIVSSKRIEQEDGNFEYYQGLYYYSLGQLKKAEQLLSLSSVRLSRSGDYHHGLSHHFLWHLFEAKGNTKNQLRHALREEQIGKLSEDKVLIAYGKYGQTTAFSRMGLLNKALKTAEESVAILEELKGSFLPIAYSQNAKVLIAAGQYREARKLAAKNIGFTHKLRFFEVTLSAFSAYCESVLAMEWVGNHSITKKDMKKAARAAIVARFCGWLFPTQTAFAFRVSGRLCAAKGKTKKALKYFDKAIAAAEKIGARYEHARALIDKSMLDHPNGMTDRERGLEMLRELECVLPVAEQEYLGIEMPPYELDEEFELESEVSV